MKKPKKNVASSISSKKIGERVRVKRQALAITLQDAASLCNVGTRFLFDLEKGKGTVHLDKALEVSARFGVRLKFNDEESNNQISQDKIINQHTLVLRAPIYDQGHWLKSRIIAKNLADACGITSCDYVVDEKNQTITCTLNNCIKLIPSDSSIEKKYGYNEVISIIDENSSEPIVDIAKIIKWAIFTTILGDLSFTHEKIWLNSDPELGVKLLPFPIFSCGTEIIEPDAIYETIKIAGELPSEWLRADHWIIFSQSVKVQPKFVFQTMQKIASIIKDTIDISITKAYKSPPTRSKPLDISKSIKARCSRMTELALVAAHTGVSGMKKTIKSKNSSIEDDGKNINMESDSLYE
jgi:HTH-type transcriptional regulator/antitoxin HipB